MLFVFKTNPTSTFTYADEQLLKDIEGVFESCAEGLTRCVKATRALSVVEQTELLTPLLTFWDGICMLFRGRPKPGGLVTLLFRTLALFDSEGRQSAGLAASQRSGPMQTAARMWGGLKKTHMKPLFETADLYSANDDRALKKQRV